MAAQEKEKDGEAAAMGALGKTTLNLTRDETEMDFTDLSLKAPEKTEETLEIERKVAAKLLRHSLYTDFIDRQKVLAHMVSDELAIVGEEVEFDVDPADFFKLKCLSKQSSFSGGEIQTIESLNDAFETEMVQLQRIYALQRYFLAWKCLLIYSRRARGLPTLTSAIMAKAEAEREPNSGAPKREPNSGAPEREPNSGAPERKVTLRESATDEKGNKPEEPSSIQNETVADSDDKDHEHEEHGTCKERKRQTKGRSKERDKGANLESSRTRSRVSDESKRGGLFSRGSKKKSSSSFAGNSTLKGPREEEGKHQSCDSTLEHDLAEETESRVITKKRSGFLSRMFSSLR